MELGIIYSIVSGILIGVSNFISKISAHRNYNKNRIILFGNITLLILSGIYLLFNYRYVEVSLILFTLIAIRIIAALEKNLFIIESLKYIETSLFFPVHKILGIFTSFIIGIIFFDEYLGKIEYLAIFLGIVMILLLSNKEDKKIQIDYKRGIFFLILSNIVFIFSSGINKYISSINFDIPTYIFISSVIGLIYLLITKKTIYKKTSKEIFKKEIFYGSIRGLFLIVSFTFGLLALREGPLVLVGMILSVGVFVPIVFSVIFYNEKINSKKLLAFLLFIIIIVLLSFR